jgi:hypothetical protein
MVAGTEIVPETMTGCDISARRMMRGVAEMRWKLEIDFAPLIGYRPA